jgi:hypothetical protein
MRYARQLLVIVTLAGRISAQSATTPSRDYVVTGLEPSYITVPSRWLGGGGFAEPRPLVFEGSIVPHLALHAWRKHDLTLVLTPKVVVRMLDTVSSPVRTPSFMPRATLTYNPWDASRAVRTRRQLPILGAFGYFKAVVSHHSNGQEDSTLIGGQPNLRSGNFSTNFVDIGATMIHEARREQRVGLRLASLSLERHFAFSPDAQRRDFGMTRANLRITQIGSTLIRLPMSDGMLRRMGGDNPERPFIRTDVTLSYLLDSRRRTGGDALFANASVAFKLRELDDFWFFAGYQRGQDPYNIQWLSPRLLSAWRIGVLGTPTTVLNR